MTESAPSRHNPAVAGVPTRSAGVTGPPARNHNSVESVRVRFARFYAEHMPKLARFVMRLGADAHTATEIAQSTFTVAYPQWGSIENPHGWLRKVAQRTYWRHVYEAEKFRELAEGEALYQNVIEQAEAERLIFEALADLPERSRQVMAWKLDGFGTADIAAELEMTEAAVRKVIERARQALKRKLGIEGGGK